MSKKHLFVALATTAAFAVSAAPALVAPASALAITGTQAQADGNNFAYHLCAQSGACFHVHGTGVFLENANAQPGQTEWIAYDYICYNVNNAAHHETVETGWGPRATSIYSTQLWYYQYYYGTGC